MLTGIVKCHPVFSVSRSARCERERRERERQNCGRNVDMTARDPPPIETQVNLSIFETDILNMVRANCV